MYDNKHSCKHTCSRSSWQASLPFAMFFSKTRERKIEATSSQTQCPVFKTLVSHWRAKLMLTVLFWPFKLFQHALWQFDFPFNEKPLWCAIVSVRQLKHSFLMPVYQIGCPALVSLPPNRKSCKKHFISLVFFSLYCKLRILVFSSLIYGQCASCLGRHKSMEKKSFHNLQYGPKTWLIRVILGFE